MTDIAIVLPVIIGLGFLSQWVSWKLKIPAIMPLLIIGIIIGPVTGMLEPSKIFADLLYPSVSLAVAIILFEGSLTLKFSEIRNTQTAVKRLISLGALVTWFLVALLCHWWLGVDLLLSILFGALMTVTGPTVIVPMLRTVRPNTKISNVLKWEGILIDPIGALLAVMVFEFIVIQATGAEYSVLIGLFLKTVLVGCIFGFLSGKLVEQLLSRHLIPDYLHNLSVLAIVLLVFSCSNYLAHESGLLTVTIMGIILANSKKIHIEDILDFKENLTVLLISILFIVLAAELNLERLYNMAGVAIGAYLIVQFIARPIAVWLSTINTNLTVKERILICWIGPRGIVAAAISALFALKLQAVGFKEAEWLVPLTFTVIIGTVFIQSLTSGFIAKMLQVADPDPNGFLIIGANPVARAIAKELTKQGVKVVLSDSSYTNIKAARMEGLTTFYGNAVSEYADRHLDLIGIGKLLALSAQNEINTLASVKYSAEFEKNKIYFLQSSNDKMDQLKHESALEMRGKRLFGDEITYKKLETILAENFEIKSTNITDEYPLNSYLKDNPRALPLFVIHSAQDIRPVTNFEDLENESEYSLLAIAKDD